MIDTYDAGYLPNDEDCNQDSIRIELAYSHDFYSSIIESKDERIAELEHVNEGLGFEIIEIEKERESLLRLISYVKSIVFSKVKCSYVSFKRPMEELLKDQGNG